MCPFDMDETVKFVCHPVGSCRVFLLGRVTRTRYLSYVEPYTTLHDLRPVPSVPRVLQMLSSLRCWGSPSDSTAISHRSRSRPHQCGSAVADYLPRTLGVAGASCVDLDVDKTGSDLQPTGDKR